jgi:hypothetical protein
MNYLLGLIVITTTVLSSEVKIERMTNVQLCYSNRAPGSTDVLVINGNYYLMDVLNEEKFSIKYLMNDLRAAGKCTNVTVTGYIVKEKGHFPNPTAEFEVFKIMDLTHF